MSVVSNDTPHIAALGAWGTVEWAIDSQGGMPAQEFFLKLTDGDKAKVIALFQRLAQTGRISNWEKFRRLGSKAGTRGRDLWEFKSFKIRFIGNFRAGGRFIIANGLFKKADDLPKREIERTVRILEEHDLRGTETQ
jgi:hypothetical protein